MSKEDGILCVIKLNENNQVVLESFCNEEFAVEILQILLADIKATPKENLL